MIMSLQSDMGYWGSWKVKFWHAFTKLFLPALPYNEVSGAQWWPLEVQYSEDHCIALCLPSAQSPWGIYMMRNQTSFGSALHVQDMLYATTYSHVHVHTYKPACTCIHVHNNTRTCHWHIMYSGLSPAWGSSYFLCEEIAVFKYSCLVLLVSMTALYAVTQRETGCLW